jgi:molybdenum cofactor cytidylyltransferase
VLVNPEPGEGPITSLRLALGALEPGVQGIAYLPLDYPLVSAGAVAMLLREATSSGASLTLPTVKEKRGHPAIFRTSLFAELLDPDLEGGGRTVVHRHLENACLVPFGDAGVITDVDTPEAYAALSADS